MKFKTLIAIAALSYAKPATTDLQPIRLGNYLPEFTGAPCSVSTDYENGKCVIFEVKSKPDWSKKGF